MGSIYMGKEGVEPSRPYGQRILSPSCMPFHHLPRMYVANSLKFCDKQIMRWCDCMHHAHCLACRSATFAWCQFKNPCRVFKLEATSGFEPLNSSFAESCLTTWLRRQIFTIDLTLNIREVFRPLLISSRFLLNSLRLPYHKQVCP